MRIGTSEPGGTFDTQGNAIATILDQRSDVSSVETVPAANASIDNANRLHAGEIDFGFMASNWIGLAGRGSAPFQQPIGLRMVSPANTGPLFFITLADSAIPHIHGMVGKRVCIGPEKSGMTQHVHTIFDMIGISFEDFTPVHMNFADGADALVSGDVDAQFQCPIPNAVMTALSERADVRVLDYAPHQLDRLVGEVPFYRRTVMPRGAFRGLDADTQQVAVLNVIVSHETVADDAVKALVETMLGNMDALADANPLFKGLDELYETLKTNGREGLEFGGVPLHPGAIEAYRDAGFLS